MLCLVFLSTNLHARWSTQQDASIKIIYDNTNISINKDYTYALTVESLDEIWKEQGRQNDSKYTFQYDIKREKIEILKAYTIFEGKKYIVTEKEIENKPLASEANALAEYGQISIAFPKVVVGAKIPNLESRIVKDVKFKIEYKSNDLLFHTNLGKGLKLRYKFLELVNDNIEDNKIDFYIDTPRAYNIKTVVKSKCIKNTKILNFNIDTTWIKLNSTTQCINKDTVITDEVLFKKSFIKNEEIKTDEFKKLKRAITDNYIGMAIIVD